MHQKGRMVVGQKQTVRVLKARMAVDRLNKVEKDDRNAPAKHRLGESVLAKKRSARIYMFPTF